MAINFFRALTSLLQVALDGLLCDGGLKFTAVIKPELLSYSSDSANVRDVVVRKSFALSSK